MNTQKKDFSSIFVRFTLVVGAILLIFSGSIIAQKVYTLEDCINLALENNIRIKQSRLEVKTAEIDKLQGKLDILPSVNAATSYSFGWGRSVDMATYQYVNQQTESNYFSINSDLTLFSGFQKHNINKQNRANYLAAKYNSDKMQNDISLMVASYYLQILFNKELLQNASAQIDITRQQIERTKKLVDAGTLARGSLLEIQAQGANEEVSVIQAENQLNLAYLDLLQLLEMEAGTPFEIDVPLLKVNQEHSLLPIDFVYKKALEVMPEVKSAEMNFESSQYGLSVARGSRSPNLSMSAALGTNYSDQIRLSNNPLDPAFNEIKPFENQWKDNRSTTLSFRLSIPIFNSYQISSYISKSKLGLMNADYNLQAVKNTLRKNVETAFADALTAHTTYKAREKSLVSLRESFNYIEQKFNVGMVNAIDYNVAKNQLNRSDSELLSAKYDYIFKLKILDFYLGRTLTLADMENLTE